MGGVCGLVVRGGALAMDGAVGSAVEPQEAAVVGSYVWLHNAAGGLPSPAVRSTQVRPHWGCTAFFVMPAGVGLWDTVTCC